MTRKFPPNTHGNFGKNYGCNLDDYWKRFETLYLKFMDMNEQDFMKTIQWDCSKKVLKFALKYTFTNDTTDDYILTVAQHASKIMQTFDFWGTHRAPNNSLPLQPVAKEHDIAREAIFKQWLNDLGILESDIKIIKQDGNRKIYTVDLTLDVSSDEHDFHNMSPKEMFEFLRTKLYLQRTTYNESSIKMNRVLPYF